MRRPGAAFLIVVLACAASAKNKERQWKEGILVDATSESLSYSAPVTGQVTGSGQVNLYGGTNSVVIWTYAIDDGSLVWVATRDLRLRSDKPFKATVNKPIKFAVEKSDVYVLDEEGKEHQLELQKKVARTDFTHLKHPDSTTDRAATVNVGTVRVSSTVDSAEIIVDGNFMGNVPATIKLSPGKHEIRVSAKGYKDVSRILQMTAGSELNLSLALEKEQ